MNREKKEKSERRREKYRINCEKEDVNGVAGARKLPDTGRFFFSDHVCCKGRVWPTDDLVSCAFCVIRSHVLRQAPETTRSRSGLGLNWRACELGNESSEERDSTVSAVRAPSVLGGQLLMSSGKSVTALSLLTCYYKGVRLCCVSVQYTDQEMIPARNARNVVTLAEVMFVTIQRENILPSNITDYWLTNAHELLTTEWLKY
jgi:hypothetical protein